MRLTQISLVFGVPGYAFALLPKDAAGLDAVGYKTYDGFVSGDLKLNKCKAEAVLVLKMLLKY